MNTLEERLRTELAAEAQAWPDPPAREPSSGVSETRGWIVGVMVAAAVFVIVGGVTVVNRAITSDGEVVDTAGLTSTTTFAETVVEYPLTLSNGIDVVVSLPLAEGSDIEAMWGAGLKRGAYEKPYGAVPFSALLHIWLGRGADEVISEIKEVERLSGSAPVPNRYIVDHDGHAYDFQFGWSSGSDLPQEILDQWLSDVNVEQRPDSIFPIVTVSDEYELTYGPQYSIEGTSIDGTPVVVGITEGCEVESGAPIEHTSDTRASVRSCVLDGRIELLVSGSPDYVERTRSHEFIRIANSS